ncbi:MAG TPA: hypothetical protein VEW93_14585 [Acidimicrobiales bacterium]|nr:hypothetical protein [Acidimicrobiales bacterium]
MADDPEWLDASKAVGPGPTTPDPDLRHDDQPRVSGGDQVSGSATGVGLAAVVGLLAARVGLPLVGLL